MQSVICDHFFQGLQCNFSSLVPNQISKSWSQFNLSDKLINPKRNLQQPLLLIAYCSGFKGHCGWIRDFFEMVLIRVQSL